MKKMLKSPMVRYWLAGYAIYLLAMFAFRWVDPRAEFAQRLANPTLLLVLLLALVTLVGIGHVENRRASRLMRLTEFLHAETRRTLVKIEHGRYYTREDETQPGILQLVCGCGEDIGSFWRDNPDAVLSLSKGHIARKMEAEFGEEVKQESAV